MYKMKKRLFSSFGLAVKKVTAGTFVLSLTRFNHLVVPY